MVWWVTDRGGVCCHGDCIHALVSPWLPAQAELAAGIYSSDIPSKVAPVTEHHSLASEGTNAWKLHT